MSDLLNKNLNESLNDEDRNEALQSLRLLVKGIPIKDEGGNLIGFIEKPDMNAIKFVLGATSNKSQPNSHSRTFTKSPIAAKIKE
jgi:hypothetical protein